MRSCVLFIRITLFCCVCSVLVITLRCHKRLDGLALS
nr:MAG TPA: hypothetical protein [Caudoviricetes sp.]